MIVRLAAALLVAGCARTITTTPVTSNERTVMAIVRLALENDAANIPSDSLYSTTAVIVINGAEHTTGKRFAAVGPTGIVRISNMTGDVMEPFAWAHVAYRWMSPDGAMTQSARASFVLYLENGAWRIRHAHSSLMLPWQRGSHEPSITSHPVLPQEALGPTTEPPNEGLAFAEAALLF